MTIKTQNEIGSKRRAYLSSRAMKARSLFAHGKARDKEQHSEQQKRKQKKFLVKGRIEGGRVVWDVYQLEGFSEPKIVGSGFSFQEEAILFARDRSLGRLSVGMSGLRGLFQAGGGGVFAPSHSIEMPNQKHVAVKHTDKGVIVG